MKKQLPVLKRLCGIETEYGIHFQQDEPLTFTNWFKRNILRRGSKRPESSEEAIHSEVTQKDIFDAMLNRIERRIPTAKPQIIKGGAFLGNGSALWFENCAPGQPTGLFELATPECRGPKQLVTANRGIEKLLVDTTNEIVESVNRDPARQFHLMKNSIDPTGTLYGCQENYEVEMIDREQRENWEKKIGALKLVEWVTQAAMLGGMLLPMVALTMVSEDFLLLISPFVLIAILIVYFRSSRKKSGLSSALMIIYISIVAAPKSILVSLFYRSTPMGEIYKKLTPFLVSRGIFAGVGGLDKNQRFVIGQKAQNINRDWMRVFVSFEHSIFCFNQIYKDLSRVVFNSNDGSLYRHRQRLCIALGDSNMCQTAEYMRIATTTLIIDAIEAGAIEEIPELNHGTIRSLHVFNRNPELNATVPTSRGEMTAIEIQQYYLFACQRYVEQLDDPPEEARDILRRWSQLLTQLRDDPESLFGQVDWITKRAMMRARVEKSGDAEAKTFGTTDEFKHVQSGDALRKIDFKYHELTSDGYYYRMFHHDQTDPVLTEESIERASRMPPLTNPAAQRSRYIREFTDQIEWVRWDALKMVDSDRVIKFESCE